MQNDSKQKQVFMIEIRKKSIALDLKWSKQAKSFEISQPLQWFWLFKDQEQRKAGGRQLMLK